MEEIGVIKDIKGPKAVVAVHKQGGGCEACPGSSLCKTMGGDEAVVEAVNQANARIGDTVRVSFKPYTYLKGTALIYGIPSLMLIAGAVIGKEYISKFFAGLDPDIMSAICGFGLFAVSFLILKLWSGRFEGKKEYMPVVEEILNPKLGDKHETLSSKS
ncbi:MAG: SoxR reducing system RseC family protein [Nitrospirae bacterium]|nr:SoxR reducing system RseC family protein [Nitrospirota bacterium]MCL5237956.1 SoxR reducing system RseC family protein [Nitrospirota bacterium]